MTREADASRAALLAEAQARADALLEDARREAASRREAAMAQARRKLDALARLGLDRAKAQAARIELEVEEDIVAETNRQVGEALARMAAGPDLEAVVLGLLAQAMARTDGRVNVHAPRAHAAACADWLRSNGFMAAEVVPDGDFTDGVVIEDQARSYRITNTLSRRFERMASGARRFAVARLLGKGTGS